METEYGDQSRQIRKEHRRTRKQNAKAERLADKRISNNTQQHRGPGKAAPSTRAAGVSDSNGQDIENPA
jgi:hypothetical protein